MVYNYGKISFQYTQFNALLISSRESLKKILLSSTYKRESEYMQINALETAKDIINVIFNSMITMLFPNINKTRIEEGK